MIVRHALRDIIGWRVLRPTRVITPEMLERGLTALKIDGVCTQVMTALITSPFLVALAIALGASNLTIGLLVALPPIAQILQLPAVTIVDYVSLRKALAVYAGAVGRTSLLLAGPLIVLADAGARLPILAGALVVYYACGAIVGCAYNPWARDLIPTDRRAAYLGRRLALATAVALVVSMAAGSAITHYVQGGGLPLIAHATVFAVGAGAGLLGLTFLARVPEPAARPIRGRPLVDIFRVPLRDRNYRALLEFLGTWNFAATMATPFFAVYMLRVMHLPMQTVVALTVVGQLATVLFFRVWGTLADRFGNRRVLQISGPLFMASLLLWPFTLNPGITPYTPALLIVIHLLLGMSTSGVTLCSGTIALKLAQPRHATAYLATNSLVAGVAGAIAPLLGGLSADFLARQQLNLNVRWLSSGEGGSSHLTSLAELELGGLEFLFVLAFLVGLYAMHLLALVREEGEAARPIAPVDLVGEVGKAVVEMSAMPGLRQLTTFPYALLRRVRERRKRDRRAPIVTGPAP